MYFAEFSTPIDKIRLNPEDHSEYGWFSVDELDKVIDNNKRADDPEIQAIIRGFELLK